MHKTASTCVWLVATATSAGLRMPWTCAGRILLVFLLLTGIWSPPARGEGEERIEVIHWHMWTGYWKDMVDDICGWFNDSQDRITVKPLVVPGASAKAKFLGAVVGGDPPDLLSWWGGGIPYWAASGVIMPLDGLMARNPGEKERLHAFLYPTVREMATYEGKLYALATSMNTFRVFYNVDHFEEAGIKTVPTTIPELEDAIDRLFRFDARGYVERGGFELASWHALMIIPAFGGRYYDDEAKRFICGNPQNLAALEWMCKISNRYGVKQLRTFDLANQSYLSGANDPFASGRMSMRLFGQWSVDIFERAMAEGLPKFRYDSFPMPPGPDGPRDSTYVNGNFNVIPANARHPEAAWEFMKFWTGLTDPDVGARIMVRGGWVPTSQAVVDSPVYQKYLEERPAVRPFVKMLGSPHGMTDPVAPIQAYFQRRLFAAVDYAMWGVKTPEEALRDLDVELERELTRVMQDLEARKARAAEESP